MSTPALPSTVTVVSHPLVHVKLTRLRDERTPTAEFRSLLAEIAGLLLCEATRDIGFQRWTQYLKYTEVGHAVYFDEGNGEAVLK